MDILIIDDDVDDINIFCEALKEVFPQAICTFIDSCSDVESKLKSLPVQDAIFLDANMFPDGKECLKRIKAIVNSETTRIIIHTGGISAAAAEEFKELGASAILDKANSYQATKANLLGLFS